MQRQSFYTCEFFSPLFITACLYMFFYTAQTPLFVDNKHFSVALTMYPEYQVRYQVHWSADTRFLHERIFFSPLFITTSLLSFYTLGNSIFLKWKAFRTFSVVLTIYTEYQIQHQAYRSTETKFCTCVSFFRLHHNYLFICIFFLILFPGWKAP